MTTTGLALAVSAMGLGRIVTSVSDREACNDRIYRLWHNYGQRRTDTFASAGAMMGIAGAALVRTIAVGDGDVCVWASPTMPPSPPHL